MKHSIQIVFDAADPRRVAEFWAAALGYALDSPPPGFDTWEAFLAANNVPEDQWNSASAVSDPDGQGPRIFIQQVPESKQVKNRVHLDINAGGGPSEPEDDRRRRIHAEAERLIGLGATQLRVGEGMFGEYYIVLQDPEGNEFCVQ